MYSAFRKASSFLNKSDPASVDVLPGLITELEVPMTHTDEFTPRDEIIARLEERAELWNIGVCPLPVTLTKYEFVTLLDHPYDRRLVPKEKAVFGVMSWMARCGAVPVEVEWQWS